MRRRDRLTAATALALALAACQQPAPVDGPPDPAGARDDSYIPFREPLRSQLVNATATVAHALRAKHPCLDVRLLRIPSRTAPTIAAHYRRALSDWKALDVPAPSGTRASGSTNGRQVFAIVQPAASQDGWAGLGIVTDTAWDPASRDRLTECRR